MKNAVHSGANIEARTLPSLTLTWGLGEMCVASQSRCGALSGLYIGDTALHIAASEGYLDIVRFLVEVRCLARLLLWLCSA